MGYAEPETLLTHISKWISLILIFFQSKEKFNENDTKVSVACV